VKFGFVHPVVDVGRSAAWHGRQVAGAGLPAAWNRPPAQLVFVAALAAWQPAQSPWADGSEWSNAMFCEVTTPVGRVFAWQSMHEPTGALPPARSDAWKSAVVPPSRP
jgi:hypothetical protein